MNPLRRLSTTTAFYSFLVAVIAIVLGAELYGLLWAIPALGALLWLSRLFQVLPFRYSLPKDRDPLKVQGADGPWMNVRTAVETPCPLPDPWAGATRVDPVNLLLKLRFEDRDCIQTLHKEVAKFLTLGYRSRVPIHSRQDMERFLSSCRYEEGILNFSFSPEEYELVRFGVCEDAARWAWTRFLSTGTPAWLVIGQHNTEDLRDKRIWQDEDDWMKHAWVGLLQDGNLLLFEATAGKEGGFLVTQDQTEAYRPYFSLAPDGSIHRHRPWRKLWLEDDDAPRGYRRVHPAEDPVQPPEAGPTPS